MIELGPIAPADYSPQTDRMAHLQRQKRMCAKAVHDDGIISVSEWTDKQRAKREAVSMTKRIAELEAENEALKQVRIQRPKPVAIRGGPIETIQRIVAAYYKITRADLISDRRTANVVCPRQIAMYLAKTLTPRSMSEIGRRFGSRDHTTALHAVRKIEFLRQESPTLDVTITSLISKITEELQ